MPRFSYLMAAGMGAAIALSNIKLSVAQTTPFLAQPQSNQSQTNSESELTDARLNAQLLGENLLQNDLNFTLKPDSADSTEKFRLAQSIPVPTFPDPTSPFELDEREGGNLPSYLNANPNPLLFPTIPEEVNIELTEPITLAEAIAIAQRNHRDLEVAQLELERSQAVLREAQAENYPNLQLRSNLTHQNSASSELSNERQRQEFGELANEQDTSSTALDGTLELSYSLFTSGRRSAQIRAAEGQVRINELEVERLSEQISFDVSEAYYDLQEADEQIRIAQAAVGNAQQSLRDAEALERAGVGTRFDVLRARVNLANETQNLTQARSQSQVAQRQLAQLLSVRQTIDITAADPVAIAGLWDLSLEESIILAYKRRAELEQQLLQREISEQQRRSALSALGPQVDLFANYNVIEVFDDELDLADGYALGARLQWNFFDGGAARARANQQERNIAIAESRFAQQRELIRFQVEQSYYNLQSNFENIQTANVALEQARESLRLARLRFQAGVGTQTEVIDAETELTRAEGNRIRAIVGYNRALASLQRAISNLSPNLLSRPL